MCSECARKSRGLQNFNQVFQLVFEDDSANVHAGEREVRPPAAPTMSRQAVATLRGVSRLVSPAYGITSHSMGIGTVEWCTMLSEQPPGQHSHRRDDEIHGHNNNRHGKWHSINGKQGVRRKGHSTRDYAEDREDNHHGS